MQRRVVMTVSLWLKNKENNYRQVSIDHILYLYDKLKFIIKATFLYPNILIWAAA